MEAEARFNPQEFATAREAMRAEFREEYPDVIAWIERDPFCFNSAGEKQFAFDLGRSLQVHGRLTDRQIGAVRRCMGRITSNVAGEGFVSVAAALALAASRGLKHPALTFEFVTFKLAKKYPGALYVTGGKRYGSTYFGRIDAKGIFSPTSEASAAICDEVARICRDPLGEVIAHGHRSGNCACCGRELRDAESISRGIGPVCFGKFFGGVR